MVQSLMAQALYSAKDIHAKKLGKNINQSNKASPKLKQIPVGTSTYMACYPVSLKILEICQKIKKEQEKYDWSLLLDSGCGTGDSTINIAKLHPDYMVLGIDKSSKRLLPGSAKNQIGECSLHNRKSSRVLDKP